MGQAGQGGGMKKRPDPAQRLMQKWGPRVGFTNSPMKLHPLVQQAVGDAVRRALRATPIKVHMCGSLTEVHTGYLIDGEVYGENEAVLRILGEYSWWSD